MFRLATGLFLLVFTCSWVPAALAMPAAGDGVVSESTGSARWQIPIEVPPGPGGFEPNVSLHYSSRAGDGPFGVGWQLSVGEVRCSTRFGVPDYGDCPRYEYNGQLLTESATAGRYHPFVETFEKIEYDSGADAWTVTAPNGVVSRYGTGANSRIEAGPGVAARWLLAEMQDPFGNQVFVTYDREAPGTAYHVYPAKITYGPTATSASGHREVRFVYEARPDPIRDFQGGVERAIDERLREIQVVSPFNSVAARHVFGYDAPGYTTTRSRLAWHQVFGSDCDDLQTDPTQLQCSSLPLETFDYTDPNDALTSSEASQWEQTGHNVILGVYYPYQDHVPAGTGSQVPSYVGDINGDGLVDVLQRTVGDAVLLNTGSGFAYDSAWSAASDDLARTQVMVPRMQVEQALGGDPAIEEWWWYGICAATLATVPLEPYAATQNRNQFPAAMIDTGWEGDVPTTTITPHPKTFLADVDSDGLADIVVSVHLSGVHITVDCETGDPLPQPWQYVEGETITSVFRNTGDPTTGWVLDPDLAEGLPPLGELAFEGAHFVERQAPRDPLGEPSYACRARGLGGWFGAIDDEVCFNLIDFDPRFVDLNGDGFVDLIALERVDPKRLWFNYSDLEYGPVHSDQMTSVVSRAWIQTPNPAAGTPRWERAPEFDLPPIPLGSPGGGYGYSTHSRIAMQDKRLIPGGASPWHYPVIYQGDTGVRLADLNRDGLTDVVWKRYYLNGSSPPDGGVLINKGRGTGASSAWCASYDECDWASQYVPPGDETGFIRYGVPSSTSVGMLADVNGDGWSDLVQLDIFGQLVSELSVGAWLYSPTGGWQADSRFHPFEEEDLCDLSLACSGSLVQPLYVPVDVNGDGAADIVGDGGGRVSVSRYPDLLQRVGREMGGEIKLNYEPSTALREPALEDAAATHAYDPSNPDPLNDEPLGPDDAILWTPAPVVSAVRFRAPNLAPDPGDPDGWSPPTTYRYAHPRRSIAARIDLGFRLVERTGPDDSRSEHYYYQYHGRAGRTAKRLLFDGPALVHEAADEWVLVPGTLPGTIDDPGVHIGRLAEMRSQAVYGGVPGAALTRTLSYDDTYGYNFVEEALETRPTAVLRTTRVPQPIGADGIVGLVQDEQRRDAGGTLLAQRSFTYTLGKVASETRVVKSRGDPGAGALQSSSFTYDDKGNLVAQTDHDPSEPSNDRTTSYCYDGNPPPCPEPVEHFSRSVVLAVTDPLGHTEFRLAPDRATGIATRIESPYEDGPELVRRELDPFGRVVKEFVTPRGGVEFLKTETIYHDDPAGPDEHPYVETFAYTDRTGSDFVRSVVVSDGFGGAWKNVTETPSGYAGTAVFQDAGVAGAATTRTTLPLDCGSDWQCKTLVGDVEPAASETELDALGRPVRVDLPDGSFSITVYGAEPRTQPAGPGTSDSFDTVLMKNPKGDLVRQLRDGDRLVWVEECANTVAPSETEPSTCTGADVSFYTYEATGEFSTIYDAIATASSDFTSFHRFFRYEYDTLGRVVKVNDPDAVPLDPQEPGTSEMAYDAFGAVAWTKNARGQETTFHYDGLGRPTSILRPGNEEDVTIDYRPAELQQASVATAGFTRIFHYDDVGRVQRKQLSVNGLVSKTFLLDFEYDALDRPTLVEYPDDETIVRYEYAGGYLEQVCEVPSASDDCADPEAVSYVSGIGYDALGRRASVTYPIGTRSYSYSETTHRLLEDDYTDTTGSGYSRTLAYGDAGSEFYDEIGNHTAIQATTSSGAIDFSASYSYDERNRLASWTPSGDTPRYYDYDPLGNLVEHGVATPGTPNQVFGHPGRPHAISSANGKSYAYDADGNLATVLGPGGNAYRVFDSQNRLVCQGTSPGLCDTLEVQYDASGARIRDRYYVDHPQGSYDLERFYVDDLLTLYVGGANHWGELHIRAFGEEIAIKKADVTLRTASGLPLAWRRIDPVPPLAGLLVLSAVLFGGLAVRRGWHETALRQPRMAALSVSLAGLLVLPPLPAQAGGGGPATTRRWLLSDHLGSLSVALMADGTAVLERMHTPFGGVHQETTGGYDVYAGHRKESRTDLVYMKARWQDPETGTFVSVDPLIPEASDPQSYNAYAYARNNPVNAVDPTGMCAFGPMGIASWGCVDPNVMIMFGSGFGNGGLDTSYDLNKYREPRGPGESGPIFTTNDAAGFGGKLSQLFSGAYSGSRSVRSGRSGGGHYASNGSRSPDSRWVGGTYEQMMEIVEAQSGIGLRLRAFGLAVLDVAGKVWAGPMTVLGLIVGLASLPFGGRVALGNNAIQFLNFPLGEPGEALTFGNVQLYPRGSDPRDIVPAYGSRVVLGAHEEGHTIQYQTYGLFFLPAYFARGGISSSNPFEQAANRYAEFGSALP